MHKGHTSRTRPGVVVTPTSKREVDDIVPPFILAALKHKFRLIPNEGKMKGRNYLGELYDFQEESEENGKRVYAVFPSLNTDIAPSKKKRKVISHDKVIGWVAWDELNRQYLFQVQVGGLCFSVAALGEMALFVKAISQGVL